MPSLGRLLHVRPVLNMKRKRTPTMRASPKAFAMVREYRARIRRAGAASCAPSFTKRCSGRASRAPSRPKDRFDPGGVLNPGKIVHAPRMNDRTLFRYPPGYRRTILRPASTGRPGRRIGWPAGRGRDVQTTTAPAANIWRRDVPELSGDPRRARRDPGRANTLRLALTGQLGPGALSSEAMEETLKLCVSCKACRRECPTGVDMARMKAEVLYQRAKKHGVGLRQRLIAALPRYAPFAARIGGLLALRDRLGPLAALSERLLGFSRRRSLPRFAKKPFLDEEALVAGDGGRPPVMLFADTFGRWFEPGTLRAAVEVLSAGGYAVEPAVPLAGGKRPLCCGRTWIAAGMLDEARAEARRTLDAMRSHIAKGGVVVGLEPSCILTLRDEFLALLPGEESRALSRRALLMEEFLAEEAGLGRLQLDLTAPAPEALLHGHCHQKSFGTMGAVEKALRLIPGMEVTLVDSSCCGMAGAFGYGADTIDISFAMGELSLLPAVRAAGPDTIIVADGTSCRHQIADGAGRRAEHVVEVLARALHTGPGIRAAAGERPHRGRPA